jgi:PDDEXK-like domain of unknown function (DUF3799)
MIRNLDVGIHAGVPEADYHADPCIEISASASILRTLLSESPMHAAYDHPRLNPAFQPSPSTEAQCKGTILHSLLLGTPPPHRVLQFDSFRTADAKAARDVAIEMGLIPILADKMDGLHEAADAIRTRLKATLPDVWAALSDPETLHEATLVFRRNGVMCRIRCDTLPPAAHNATYDLKFTGRSAEPDAWGKQLRDNHLFQPALYPYGIEELRGDAPEFRFLVCEWDPPYGISVHALDPVLENLAHKRLDEALELWASCLKSGKWPGYPPFVHYAEAPGWMLTQEDSRTLARASLREAVRRRDAVVAVTHRFEDATGGPAR